MARCPSYSQNARPRKANAVYSKKEFEYLEVMTALKGFSSLPDLPGLDALQKVIRTSSS
jgi:hypothetical protein